MVVTPKICADPSQPTIKANTRNITILISKRKRMPREPILLATISRALNFIKFNKVLLVLIVVCGCLIVLYANSELLVRKSVITFFLPKHRRELQTSPEQKSSSQLHKQLHSRPIAPLLLMTIANNSVDNTISKRVTVNNVATTNGASGASSDYNIFVIYTKENYQLHSKFELFARSLLKHASIRLHLHVITDESSESSARDVLQQQMYRFNRSVDYQFYDIHECTKRVADVVGAMTPFFSSTPKSYYSDTLFFLSLGLHRIADPQIKRAVLLDCDIVFRSDVRLLFAEFERFSSEHLFGLAPELTPVYRHILYRYRANFPDTSFGSPYYPPSSIRLKQKGSSNTTRLQHGYPGLNSGVVLLYLSRIRASKFYRQAITEPQVRLITTKYSFRGHLGDQDFFTLLGFDNPNLIYRLDCVWNRQLCTWWKDHGYSEVFDAYFYCKGKVQMYHGNCNSRIPE